MVKCYAVRVGREGPKIYATWAECEQAVTRWPGALHKSFPSRQQAQVWLAGRDVTTDAKAAINEDQNRVTARNHPSGVDFASTTNLCLPAVSTSSTTKLTWKEPSLSFEQQSLVDSVVKGRNVFFTGSAGVGKSLVLRSIISALGGPSQMVAVTASTGIASVNIGGTTLHSWAGIGLGEEPKEKLADKLQFQTQLQPKKETWEKVATLIVDEISMLDGVLFDKLEYVARRLRRNDQPFGGIQLVLSGDFCQLPPVPNRHGGIAETATFAFDADSWEACVGSPVILTKVFRQKDPEFVRLLNQMRFGELDRTSIASVSGLSRPMVYDDGIEPTELYPTRREVELANRSRLDRLASTPVQYTAHDIGGYDSTSRAVRDPNRIAKLLDRLVAPPSLSLKVGAQVMLIKNMVQGILVNGSVGQIVDFLSTTQAAETGTDIADINSDQRNLPGTDDYNKLQTLKKQGHKWPLVRFTNGHTLLCTPVDFTVNNSNGEFEAKRVQVPLILAWALSVHKSQGQTLERVKVDLGRTFEKGQAYVALSRATGLKTLQVLNFSPSKVEAHPRVLEWYKSVNDRHQMELDHMLDEEEDNARTYGGYYL